MARQQTNLLALVPGESPLIPNTTLSARSLGRSLTREEEQIQIERDVEAAVITATEHLGEVAITAINELYIHAYGEFSRTAAAILAIADTATQPDHRLYLDAYAKQLIPRLAHHDTGIIEVTAHAIARELHRDKHPVATPLSLVERIFGRW